MEVLLRGHGGDGGATAVLVHMYVCMHVCVAEWLRAWDTLTMFEAKVCGRS